MNSRTARSLSVKQGHHLTLQQLQGRRLASDVMSLKYDRDGEYLALGAKNGSKILYSLTESKHS